MIRKYQKGDWLRINPQRAQCAEALVLTEQDFLRLEAYSVLNQNGKVVAILGFRPKKQVLEAFALLDQNCREKMIEIVRGGLKILQTKALHMRKITCTVKADFEQGLRAMKLLNFQPKKIYKNYFNGTDYLLFERENI